MRPVLWFLALVLAMAGSACTTVLAPERTTAIGPPFNEALKERYLELGASKWQEGSWEILHFRDKARSAMLGDVVDPDRVTWVPSELQGELIEQRERLLLFLDAGARELVPEDAAEAQVAFDCWLSDVESHHAARLRMPRDVRRALGRTEQAVLAELPESYVVLFEAGSDTVGGAGLNVATAVARAVPLVEPARIESSATPILGSAAANEALSLRRAENVAAALERAGRVGGAAQRPVPRRDRGADRRRPARRVEVDASAVEPARRTECAGCDCAISYGPSWTCAHQDAIAARSRALRRRPHEEVPPRPARLIVVVIAAALDRAVPAADRHLQAADRGPGRAR